MILTSILEAIGHTPIVRLNRVGQSLPCELYAKCEFLNPGGSVKDRIAIEMIDQAEREGLIRPGDTLIEATSGNTGIGFALAGAVKGYSIIITMPEKMSHEKEVTLLALGAKIYRTPTTAKWDDPDSHISLAKRLQKEIPRAHILDQYSNPNNPGAHAKYTANEILEDMGKDLAMVVMGVGTGGTITGVGKALKAAIPDIKIIGADPVGSILGGGTEVKPYLVEGIGYDFFPSVLDNDIIDQYIKVDDASSFNLARALIREEGLLVGGSSGTALFAALKAAQNLKAGQKCLVILPDGIRNYMTKFADNQWMKTHGFAMENCYEN